MKKVLWIIPVLLMCVAGCSENFNLDKSIEEVKTEVNKLSLKNVETKAIAYTKEIEKVKAEADKVKAELKELSPKELFGDKATAIKDEINAVSSELSALTKRYSVYADKFKELGGDLSAIKTS